jgi:hypothetical protein
MVRRRPDRLREEEGTEASSPAWGVPGAVVPEPEDILDVTSRAIATGRFVSAAASTWTPPAQIGASDLAAPAFARAAVGRRDRERRRRCTERALARLGLRRLRGAGRPDRTCQ